MIQPSASRSNVLRILKHYGLGESVVLTRDDEDRVWGWPVDDSLMRYCVLNSWDMDLRVSALAHHGTAISFREPGGVRPALQICFHKNPKHTAGRWDQLYFIELDIDFVAPDLRRPWSLIGHAVEVTRNLVTRGKTNQEKVARMLDERFKV